jgi:hypothetical protein
MHDKNHILLSATRNGVSLFVDGELVDYTNDLESDLESNNKKPTLVGVLRDF